MVLTAAILWGLSGTAAQVLFSVDAVHPGWLVTIRMGIAGVLLLIASGVRQGFYGLFAVWRHPAQSGRLLVYALLGLLGVQYSYLAAIAYSNAATATLLQYIGPTLIMLYLAVRSGRLPSLREGLAVIFTLIGTALLVTNGDMQRVNVSRLGLIWGLLSAVTLAFYTVFPERLLHRFGSLAIVGWSMVLGALVMSFRDPPWRVAPFSVVHGWLLIMFIALFGTLLAFFFYSASLRYLTPAQVGLLATVEPLAATVAAMLILNVRLGMFAIFGGLLILLSVMLLTRSSRAI